MSEESDTEQLEPEKQLESEEQLEPAAPAPAPAEQEPAPAPADADPPLPHPQKRGRPSVPDAAPRKRRTQAEIMQDKLAVQQAKLDALRLQHELKEAQKRATKGRAKAKSRSIACKPRPKPQPVPKRRPSTSSSESSSSEGSDMQGPRESRGPCPHRPHRLRPFHASNSCTPVGSP